WSCTSYSVCRSIKPTIVTLSPLPLPLQSGHSYVSSQSGLISPAPPQVRQASSKTCLRNSLSTRRLGCRSSTPAWIASATIRRRRSCSSGVSSPSSSPVYLLYDRCQPSGYKSTGRPVAGSRPRSSALKYRSATACRTEPKTCPLIAGVLSLRTLPSHHLRLHRSKVSCWVGLVIMSSLFRSSFQSGVLCSDVIPAPLSFHLILRLRPCAAGRNPAPETRPPRTQPTPAR